MHLLELIVIGCVSDRRQMKIGVEFFIAELLTPMEGCQILGDEIAAIAREVFEIAGTKSSITVRRASENLSCKVSVRLEPIKPAPPVTTRLRGESDAGIVKI